MPSSGRQLAFALLCELADADSAAPALPPLVQAAIADIRANYAGLYLSLIHICEFVMCYPPGIPILAPGERITKEILNYIEYAKAKGCSMTGPEDPDILHLNVLA